MGAKEVARRVSTIELFFDLVFVFTLTQLTALLEHHVTLEAAAQVGLILVVLFWMYGGFVWLTNQVPPDRAWHRLLLMGGMAAFLICALAIPEAFGAAGVTFGVGYLLVVSVHGALYWKTYGRAVLRFVPMNILGAILLIGAGLLEGPVVYALWVAVIGLQKLAATLTSAVDEERRAGFDIDAAHFVERHGLLLLVAFGESIVAIGAGVGDVAPEAGEVAAMVLGVALASALWWAYFDEDADRAESALAAAPLNDRVRRALGAYFYAYIPMLLGIIVLAAGVILAIGDVGATLDPGPALLLGGGVGLYLAGTVAFRAALHFGPLAYRAGSAVVTTATMIVGIGISGLTQLAVLVFVLVVMLVSEARSRPRSAAATS
jgi:low temperature requirement protein LtrA